MAYATGRPVLRLDASHMAPVERASCEKHLLRLAARQHGIVTRHQTLDLGLTKAALESRIRRGQLQRLHPGIYCVAGAPKTFEQRAFAAAAWGGEGAVVSHSSAGFLWRMIEAPPEATEVSSVRKRTRPPRGLRTHFTSDLPPRDRGKLWNIPVTSPARTLIDLAGTLPECQVERALHHAIVERRVTAHFLTARLRAAPTQGARGPAVLRRLMASSRSGVTSPLERAVARALTCAELPPFCREHPVNVDGGVYYLDFAWPPFRVGVEADSRRWHSDAGSFEHDRVRHNALTAAGWRVVRVTERQAAADPQAVRDRVLGLLVRG